MNNYVAKNTWTFNKPKVEPNKKKHNIREYYLDDVDEFTIEYVSPEGDTRFEVLDNIKFDKDTIQVRHNLMKLDCTFIRIFKNDEEIL